MRRTIEQVENEILERRTQHERAAEKRRRAVKTAVLPALSAAAVFALVFSFAILPLIKGRGLNSADGEQADPSISANAGTTYGANVPGNAEAMTGEPSDNAAAGPVDGPSDGMSIPWICGTPILEGGWFEPPNGQTYGGAMPDGGILVVPVGEEERESLWLSAELAGRMYEQILRLEPVEGAELPDGAEARYVVSLEFEGKSLRVVALGEGSFVLNAGTVCTLDAASAAELDALVNEARK